MSPHPPWHRGHHERRARRAARRGAACSVDASLDDPLAEWRRGPLGFRARWLKVRLQRRIFFTLALCAGLGFALGRGVLFGSHQRAWTLVALGLLAAAGSGALAWYLTRPLLLVVRAARELGAGKLDARVPMQGSDELAFLAASLNDMAERIGEKLREQRQLLAAVSHELRTPLGHLRILIDTARERGAPPAVLDQLEREVIDLDRLVARLLASSRLEFGHLDGKLVSLGELVAEVALAHDVDADVISVEGDPSLVIDPTLVRRAVANLIENAQRHGGGAVAVTVRGSRAEATIEVDDAGPGVPAERRADAFTAFVPSKAGGLGLGLALVQRIALAHQGEAWLVDRPGGGTRAGFSLRAIAAGTSTRSEAPAPT